MVLPKSKWCLLLVVWLAIGLASPDRNELSSILSSASLVYPNTSVVLTGRLGSAEIVATSPLATGSKFVVLSLPPASVQHRIELWDCQSPTSVSVVQVGTWNDSTPLSRGGILLSMVEHEAYYLTPHVILPSTMLLYSGGVNYTASTVKLVGTTRGLQVALDGSMWSTNASLPWDRISTTLFKAAALAVPTVYPSYKAFKMGGWTAINSSSSTMQQGTAASEVFAWSTVTDSPSTPPSRLNHTGASVNSSAGNFWYIFGGVTQTSTGTRTLLNDLLIFDLDNLQYSFPDKTVGSWPSARQGHAMVLVTPPSSAAPLISPSGGAFLFVFGGMNAYDSTDTLVPEGDDWGYDLETETWFQISIPTSTLSRRSYALVVSPTNSGFVAVSGGTLGDAYTPLTGEIYTIDFTTSSPPVAVPITPPPMTPPQNPVSAPSPQIEPTPVSAPVAPGCSTTPPIGNFSCVNGTWTALASVQQTTIVVPATTIVIQGNLTVQDITFNGLGSSVQVYNGCTTIVGGVTVQLTPADIAALEKLPAGERSVTLISQGSNCTSFSSSLTVAVTASKSCRKVSASSSTADATRLAAVFAIDSSWCQNRWIILGCVLGGALLIVAILALFFTFNQRAKDCIRPYSSRREGANDAPEM